MNLQIYTGGYFDTNSYFFPDSGILIDAPEGVAEWLQEKGWKVSTLLLTHGHIDHVWDAALLQSEHGCRLGYHVDGERMITERDFFKTFGYPFQIEPSKPGFHIEETESLVVDGVDFRVLLVPGHCPGSLCFLEKTERILFGGDVLFAGSVGRSDLPGGDEELLYSGIRNKLFPLGDDVTVLSGHGPATKIGIERTTNPYVGET